MALFLVKEPVLQIIKNLKELVLFSPEQDVMDEIRKVVNEDIQNYDYSLDFLDVTHSGRNFCINLYNGSLLRFNFSAIKHGLRFMLKAKMIL